MLSGNEILSPIKGHNSVANLQKMTLYNPNLDLANALMCIQILVKFCPLVLKILSGNEMETELQNYGITEGQGKSNIAPIFLKGGL